MTRSSFRLRLALALLAGAFVAATPDRAQAQEAERTLVQQLEGAIATYGWSDATWGVVVRSLDTGETLFERNPDVPLAPASNAKLLTTATALHVLGPEYRFRTYVVSDGEVRDGVLHGDVTLYGTGDPGISDRFYHRREDVFNEMADELVAAGIHRITGGVAADASFFPGPLRHPGWDPRDLNEHFTAGISALSYNENVVSFRIRAADLDAAPEVLTVPAPSGMDVMNTATTVSDRARPRIAILRDDPLEPVRIEGRIQSGSRDVWRQMTVSVPARFAGEVFRAALERKGIVVEGRDRVVDLPYRSAIGRVSAPALGRPGARILARHVSRPLRDYLAVVNKESNNFFAEVIFRAVGRVAEGVGSFGAGARTVKRTLYEIGVDTTGLSQLDGSGLAGGNRVTAQAFVQTIAGMGETDLWPEYWATLPEAGTRRELGRMYRTAAAGNLRAKTGTIERVSALSGMVRSQDGERLAFSILVNDSRSPTRAKRVENLIGVRLASFRRAEQDLPAVLVEAPGPSAIVFTGRDRHQVARGENLSAIAMRYGVSLDEILRLNPTLEPNRIVPGEWIEIPGRGGS